MRPKRPFVASLDQVRISRHGQKAIIEYADSTVGSVSLGLGEDVTNLSDQEILDRHNNVILAMQDLADSYEHVAVEVPPGSPQLRYEERSDQWVPRGGVVRCVVSDGGPDGEATFWIDDREMSLREFGRMMTTYSGWGCRIIFVPEDETQEPAVVEVRKPEE